MYEKNKNIYICNHIIFILSSCQSDIIETTDTYKDTGLYFSLAEVESAESERTNNTDLNETIINNIQILIFNSTGLRTSGGYFSFSGIDNQERILIASGDWRNNVSIFDNGANEKYMIYVLANSTNGSYSLRNIKTLKDLNIFIEKDADIWKYNGSSINGNNKLDKSFVMAGMEADFIPSNNKATTNLSIMLQHLAAKIEVNLVLSEKFKKIFKPLHFEFTLRNYSESTYLNPLNQISSIGKIVGNDNRLEFSNAYQENLQESKATLISYTYPTDWKDNTMNETYILVNIPGYYSGGIESENGLKVGNFYKIPIIRDYNNEIFHLTKGTHYKVNAVVDRLGQLKPDIPEEISGKLTLHSWGEYDINVSHESVNFLELYKSEIQMNNVGISTEQYFSSSTPVETSIREVYYFDKYGMKIKIYPNEYNKYNIKVSHDKTNSGFIKITSKVPENNGIRYIKIRVRNKKDNIKDFIVKQYPLEYIITIPGWHSYRSDFIYGNQTVNYEMKSIEDLGYGRPTTSNDIFSSKVYDTMENRILYLKYDLHYTNFGYSYWLRKLYRSDYTGGDNNNMYFVRITRSSDQYIIAEPAVDNNGYTESSSSNNKLVSPSFMIASQLGTVSRTSFNEAKKHCKNM